VAGVVDAHRDGKRFIVRADEKLTGRLGIASRVLLIAKKRIHGTKPRLLHAGTRKLFGISPRFTQMVLTVRSEGLPSLHLGIFKIGAALS
jgi:hypothetical protein